MQGGEGMVAVVQGLRDAGLAVTVVNRTYLQNAMKKDSRRRMPATQSSETNTDQVTRSTSTQMCGRHAANELTYGNYSLPNASMPSIKQHPEFPLQRAEPSRTTGNFQVGAPAVEKVSPSVVTPKQTYKGSPTRSCNRATGYCQAGGPTVESNSSAATPTQTFQGAPMRNYNRRLKGPVFSASSSSPRASDAFIQSLRRYPLPADKSVSTELVQRLLNYTETKHFSRKDSVSMQSLRNKNHRPRESREARGCKESKGSKESRTAKRIKEARESFRESKANGARKLLEFKRANRDLIKDREFNVARAVSDSRGRRESDDEKNITDLDKLTDSEESEVFRQLLREVRIKYNKSKDRNELKEIRQIKEIITKRSKDNRQLKCKSRNEFEDLEEAMELRESEKVEEIVEFLDIKDSTESNETKTLRDKEDFTLRKLRDSLKISDSKDNPQSTDEKVEIVSDNNYQNSDDAIKVNAEKRVDSKSPNNSPIREKYREVNDSDVKDHREVRESVPTKQSIESKQSTTYRTNTKCRETKRNKQYRRSGRLSDSRRNKRSKEFIGTKESRGSRDARSKKRNIKVNNFMQTYTRTSNEVLREGAARGTKVAGSPFEDNSNKDQLSETYNYLEASHSGRPSYTGRDQEIRYLHDVTKCVRDAIEQILQPPIVCPTMQDRYIQHRREHHHDHAAEEANPQDGICITQPSTSRDVAVSFRCRPPLGTRRTCIFRPLIPPCPCEEPDPKSLYQNVGTSESFNMFEGELSERPSGMSSSDSEDSLFSEDDLNSSSNESYKQFLDDLYDKHSSTSIETEIQEAAILKQIGDNIYEHLNDLAVVVEESPEMVEKCGEIIKELASQLKELQGQENYPERAKEEIKKSINKLPMWFPGEKEDEPKLVDEMADNILGALNINEHTFRHPSFMVKSAKRLKTKSDKRAICEWINDLPTLSDGSLKDRIKQAKVASQMAFIINKTDDWNENKEKVIDEIKTYLDTIPMWLPDSKFDQHKLKKQVAENLLHKLTDLNDNVPNKFTHVNGIEKNIQDWLTRTPIYSENTSELEKQKKRVAKRLAKKLRNMDDTGDVEKKAKKKIKRQLDKLPLEWPISKQNKEKLKKQLADNLLDNILKRNHPKNIVSENVEECVRDWLEDVCVFTGNDKKNTKKKEKVVHDLSKTLKGLEGHPHYTEKAIDEIQKYVKDLPKELSDVKIVHRIDSQQLAEELVETILKEDKSVEPNIQERVRDWLETESVFSEENPKTAVQIDEMVENLTRIIGRLKGHKDLKKNIKEEIKKGIESIPIERTERSKTKVIDQLADNLLEYISNVEDHAPQDEMEEQIRDWLEEAPIISDTNPKTIAKKERVIKDLALKLNRLKGRDDYQEKANEEIKKGINALPIELPGTTQNQQKIKKQLAESILDSISKDDTTKDSQDVYVEEQIRDWLKEASIISDNTPKTYEKKEEVVKDLARKLNRLKGRDDYQEKANEVIKKGINALPIELSGTKQNQEKIKKQLAENLLHNMSKDATKNSQDAYVEEKIRDWLKEASIISDNTPKTIFKKEKVVKDLARKLNRLKGSENYQEKANEEIKKGINALPMELSGTKLNQQKIKKQLAESLLDNISKDETKNSQDAYVEEQIRDWLKEASIISHNTPKTYAKKEEVVKDLARKLNQLKGCDDYQEKANEEIKKGINALPMELSGTKQNQEKIKKQLAENLLDSISEDVETKRFSVGDVEEQIREWLEAEHIFTDVNPKTTIQKENMVKDLSKEIKNLRGRKNFKTEAKEKIRKSINAVPTNLTGTEQSQSKMINQLADNLLENILNPRNHLPQNEVERQIRDWLEEAPIKSDVNPITKAEKKAVVKELAQKLNRLKGHDDFQEKAKEQIRKSIDTLPMEISGTKRDQEMAKRQLTESLLENIVNIEEPKKNKNNFAAEPNESKGILKSEAKRNIIVKQLAGKLKHLRDNDDFEKTAKKEIDKVVDNKQLGSQQEQSQLKSQLWKNLLDYLNVNNELGSLGKVNDLNKKVDLDDQRVDKEIRDWYETLPIYPKDKLNIEASRERTVKDLAVNLKLLKGRDDFQEQAEVKIKNVVNNLPLKLHGSDSYQEIVRNEVVNKLMENISNAIEVNNEDDEKIQAFHRRGTSYVTKVYPEDNIVEEQILEWLEKVPVTDRTPKLEEKKEKMAKNLADSLKRLKGRGDYVEKAREEIKKHINDLPMELAGTTGNKDIVITRLADTLIDNINESTKPVMFYVPEPRLSATFGKNDNIETQVRSWLNEVPVFTEDNKENETSKETTVKNVARKLERLKDVANFNENARKEIKKYIDTLPLEISGTVQNQEVVKNELVDNLMNNLSNVNNTRYKGKQNYESMYNTGNLKYTYTKPPGQTSCKHAIFNHGKDQNVGKERNYVNTTKSGSANKDFYKTSNLKENSGKSSEQRRLSINSASSNDQKYLNNIKIEKDDVNSKSPSRRRRLSNDRNDFYNPNVSYDNNGSSDKREYLNAEQTSDFYDSRKMSEEQNTFENMSMFDTNLAITDKVIEEQIVKWLKKVPVFRTDDEENKSKQAETVKELSNKLQNHVKKNDYDENAKSEIEDHIDILPMFFPGSKNDQDKSKDRLAETLLRMIRDGKLQILKVEIMDWLNEVNILHKEESSGEFWNSKKFTKYKDKVADNFAETLLPIMQKPVNVLKEKVIDLIEELPGKEISGSYKQAISEIANKLVRRLKPNAHIEEEIVYESEIEEHIWNWLENTTAVSNETKREKEYLVKNFVKKIKNMQSQNESSDAFKTEIAFFLESLTEEMDLSSRQKRELIKSILKEINYRDMSSINLYQEGNEISERIVDEISELIDDIAAHIASKPREQMKENIADVIAPNVFDLSYDDSVKLDVANILTKDAKLTVNESRDKADEIIVKVNGMDFPLNFRRGTITEMEMRDIVTEEVTVILDDFDIPSEYLSDVEQSITEVLVTQIVRDIDDATTENEIISILVNSHVNGDDIEPLTRRLMRRNREMSVCYRSPDKSFKLLMKNTNAESFLLSPTERRIFEEKAEVEILDFDGEITGDDSSEIRVKRKPEVVNLAAKVAMLMADPNGLAREDRIMREISVHLSSPFIDTNYDREKLSKILRERLRKIDYKTAAKTSTPHKDRVSYFIPNDISVIDFDEDDDNRTKKRQRSKSKTQSQLLHDESLCYCDLLTHAIKLWMNEVGLTVNLPDEQGFKNNMCKDIASDVMDRQKYLESTVTSEQEELDHLKYQLFRWLNKVTDPEYLSQIVSTAQILMDKINAVPLPQLVDPNSSKLSFGQGFTNMFTQDSSQFIAENLVGAIVVWLKRQPFYQERSLEDKKTQESLIPKLVQTIIATIMKAKSESCLDVDDLLITGIVKELRGFPMDFQYRTMYIYDLAKRLLNHLKNLQLFQDISNRESTRSKSITENLEEPINEQKASTFLENSIAEWCANLPIEAGTREDVDKIKQQIADTLIKQFVKLNNDPHIFYNESLYDEMVEKMIDETMERFTSLDPQTILPLKKALILLAKKARLKAMQEKSMENQGRQSYIQELCKTISETLPHDLLTIGERATFELLKSEVADDFVDLHYVGGKREKALIKNKIQDEMDKFFVNLLSKHPSSPITSEKLNRDLYSALKRVPIPSEETFRRDAELIKIKNVISNWIKELPIEEQTDTEKLETRKIVLGLAEKIHEIERQKDLCPIDDDYDENMKREILNVVTQIPRLGITQDEDLKKAARKLIYKLNNTKDFRRFYTQFPPPGVPPCALSIEDVAHLQRIRERASLRLRASSPCSTYFTHPTIDAISQTEILCAGPGLCQGRRMCHENSTNPHCVGKLGSGVQTPPQIMPSVGSQIVLSPQVIIKEYYWDSLESSLATPCVSNGDPCTFSRCTMTEPVLSHRSICSPPRQFICESQPVPHRCQLGPTSNQHRCPHSVSKELPSHRTVCQQKGQYTRPSPCAGTMTDNISQPQRSQQNLSNINPQRPFLPTSIPCSPHAVQGQYAQPQTRPRNYSSCFNKKPWCKSQELISSEDAEPSCSFRRARVTHLGSFDHMEPKPSRSQGSDWVCPENDNEFWEGNRRCLISQKVTEACNVDRQRREERAKCRCKERVASDHSGRRGRRGRPRCSLSPNRAPVSSCSKYWGVHCPYPSYMFFR